MRINKKTATKAIKNIKEIGAVEVIYHDSHIGNFTELLFILKYDDMFLDDVNQIIEKIKKKMSKIDGSVCWNEDFNVVRGVSKTIKIKNNKLAICFFFE